MGTVGASVTCAPETSPTHHPCWSLGGRAVAICSSCSVGAGQEEAFGKGGGWRLPSERVHGSQEEGEGCHWQPAVGLFFDTSMALIMEPGGDPRKVPSLLHDRYRCKESKLNPTVYSQNRTPRIRGQVPGSRACVGLWQGFGWGAEQGGGLAWGAGPGVLS